MRSRFGSYFRRLACRAVVVLPLGRFLIWWTAGPTTLQIIGLVGVFFYLSFCSKTNKIIVFFCVNKISMRYYFHLVHTSIFRIKVQINYAVYGHMDTSMEDMIISSHN